MKVKNHILNYFVSPSLKPEGTPRVFLSPVTMNSAVGKTIIEKELGKQKDSLSKNRLLHVCFDLDSGRLYLPNASEFISDQIYPLLTAAKIKIMKDFKWENIISSEKPIEGSPFSSLRVRKVSSFEYAKRAIFEHFNKRDFNDMVVIEANLARMPSTTKQLPCYYRNNKNFVGGYIGSEISPSIKFYDEIDIRGKLRKNKIFMLELPTPFILIDISPGVNPSATEKEWAVLSGYRDFLYAKSENKNNQDIASFADLYAAKRHLYLGWPFEEVCKLFLERAKDFGEMINAIQLLLTSAHDLVKEGYNNPAKNSYFITFKINPKTFPLRMNSLITDNGNCFDPNKQINTFRLIEFDKETGYIIIETPAFIESNLCIKILKAKSRPFICKYNPAMNTIDVKSQDGLLKELKIETDQLEKIKALVILEINKNHPDRKNKEEPQFRTDERARGISLSNPDICHVRKISEYYYATDHIKKMCKDRNIPFIDIDVVIGPLERIFGRGVSGGFMGEKQFSDSKLKIPHQIVKGLFVRPPIMAVDSASMPSYAKQTEVLIHEYSHNLYSLVYPNHKHLYHKYQKIRNKDELQYWYWYLTDPDERLAHKEEIKYELLSGVSVDEIIRDKVGGSIDMNNYAKNYPIALKFKELVEEVVTELQKEEEL